jgi:FKBP-type peptidyl-prolyl cis-trans isomerase
MRFARAALLCALAVTLSAACNRGDDTPSDPFAAPADVAAAPADAERTASGLASKMLQKGSGTTKPQAHARVKVHYTGWTTDGQMFDSSHKRGEPTVFGLRQVIPGWTEGVQLMVEGEKRRFWIPTELAYNNAPGAPQGMLVFDIELIDIIEPPAPPADLASPPADAQKTPAGLITKVIAPGTGTAHPDHDDRVVVHYSAWFQNGELFDSTAMRGEPATIPIADAISGFRTGVQLMVEGETRRLWIPESLAFAGKPGAPKGMIVFDVELVRILK